MNVNYKDVQVVPKPLPCPFCGGAANADWHRDGATGAQHFVSCDDEDCAGYNIGTRPTYARKADAVAAWNRRTPTGAAP